MTTNLQIRIDKEVKERCEALYASMGTSFTEAIRMFAYASLKEGGLPFNLNGGIEIPPLEEEEEKQDDDSIDHAIMETFEKN